jgi:hypothetical protein
MRLREKLGAGQLATAAERVDGVTVRALAEKLPAAEVVALVTTHPAGELAWAARTLPGPAVSEVLKLPAPVRAVLADPAADLPAWVVHRMMQGDGALTLARLEEIAKAVSPAELGALRRQFGNEGFMQLLRTEDRPANLHDMAGRLAASPELAGAAALPSGATVLDANLLIPTQRLRAGEPWKGGTGKHALHDGDRARIAALAKRFGVGFANPTGEPTLAEIEQLMAKIDNRAPAMVLAETQAVAGTSRGTGLVVDRTTQEYQMALREMAGSANPVGEARGGADRSAIADLLFADRAPNAKAPVFHTDDEKVVRPLLERYGDPTTYTAVPKETPKGLPKEHPKGWADRFVLANPDGFEVVIRGRRIRIVWIY